MILGVIEGQIRGGYFPDCILDPSMIDPSAQASDVFCGFTLWKEGGTWVNAVLN